MSLVALFCGILTASCLTQCRRIAAHPSLLGLFLLLTLATQAARGTPPPGGWLAKTEEDPLTGREVHFARGYTAGGNETLYLDVIKREASFFFRFGASRRSTGTAVLLPGSAVAVTKEPSVADLGTSVSWAVEGRKPHEVQAPRFTRQTQGNITDYRAEWRVSCEDLRELAIGGVVRVVSDNEAGKFTLAGFDRTAKKALSLDTRDLIARKAGTCPTE